MNFVRKIACLIILLGTGFGSASLMAQSLPNSIESILVSQQGGEVLVKVTTKTGLSAVPANFSVASPARVAFDFPSTGNAIGRNSQTINEAHLRSYNLVEVGDRTRLVLNLNKLSAFNTRLDGRDLYISLSMPASSEAVAQSDQTSRFRRTRRRQGSAGAAQYRFPPGQGWRRSCGGGIV
jgi:type IV pilus assembly protein PilQ